MGATRKVRRTVTAFRALDLRRQRAQELSEGQGYSVGDSIDGRYEILDVVGRGPLGTVYRASEAETGLVVALKAIHPQVASADADGETFADAFARIGRHDSPDVLRVIPLRDGERLLVRSRFITGLSLRKAIELRAQSGQRFELHEVGPRVFQMVRALEHLHPTAPHGFLKPENVLLTPEGVRVTDFGLFQAIEPTRFVSAQQDAGAFVYLAPELRNGQSPDARSDVYSIGTILFELLTGKPFEENGPSLGEVVGEPGSSRWRETDALIAQATSAQPADRFQSVADFGDAFAVTMEAQALILSGKSSGGATTVRVALADVQEQSVSSSKAFDREETESHAPVVVDPSLLEEHEASFDESGSAVSEDATDTTGVYDVDEEDIFDDLVPTEVEGVGKRAQPEEERSPPDSTVIGAVAPGPWFLRSNLGFVIAVLLIVGAVVGMVSYYISIQKGSRTGSDSAVVIKLPEARQGKEASATKTPKDGDTQGAVASKKTLTDGVAKGTGSEEPSSAAGASKETGGRLGKSTQGATPERAGEPSRVGDSPKANSPFANVQGGTQAKSKLGTKASAERSAEPTQPKVLPAPKVKPVAKPAPKPVAKPTPKPVAKPTPKPVAKPAPKPVVKPTPKPAARPAPKPVAKPKVAARPAPPAPKLAPAPAPPPAEKSGPASVSSDGTLSCPRGMRIVTTARFPRGSIRRQRIKGSKAIDLAKQGKAYCIDIYEFPGKGSMPQTRVNFAGAKSLCARSGKRLCTDREWQRGCKGKGGAAFPYGRSFRGGVCNTETADGDEGTLKATGRFRRCRSRWTLYDMSGNVAEWTADKTVRGGDIAASDEDAACNSGGRRSPGSKSSTIGFRCCKSF